MSSNDKIINKKLILVTDVNIKVYADVVTIKKDAVESFIEEESSLQYYALFSPNNFMVLITFEIWLLRLNTLKLK